MKAGRELDALVAEKVMGYVWRAARIRNPEGWLRLKAPWLCDPERYSDDGWGYTEPLDGTETLARDYHREVPRYSTAIAETWDVVEKMRGDGYMVTLGGRPDAWECAVISPGGLEYDVDDIATAPLAICRAVLKALGLQYEAERGVGL